VPNKYVVPPRAFQWRQKAQILRYVLERAKVKERVAAHFAASIVYPQKYDTEIQNVEKNDVCG